MTTTDITTVWIDERVEFSLLELSLVCRVETGQLLALVNEGVLQPSGAEPATPPEHWRFDGSSLGRALAAVRLARDFELSPAGTALALDLLSQIKALRAQLRQFGVR